jgi:hypothetical protein
MKYIVTEKGAVVIFSDVLTHKQVARGLGVMSGGSVQFTTIDGDIAVRVYGRAESLDLDRHKEDGDKIYRSIIRV